MAAIFGDFRDFRDFRRFSAIFAHGGTKTTARDDFPKLLDPPTPHPPHHQGDRLSFVKQSPKM
jgi:hypothetical protein